MSASTRRFHASVALLSLGLMACTADDGGTPLAATSAKPASSSEIRGTGGAASPTPSAATSSPATAGATLQSLQIFPSKVTLSSDPAANSNGTNLTVVAQLSNGQSLPTTVAWSSVPSGVLGINAAGYVSVPFNTPAGQVTLTASTGSLSVSTVVQITAKPLSVSAIALSPSALSLYMPAADGVNTAGLPTTAQLFPVVTMSDLSTNTSVTWQSSDATVATVSLGGLVTALGVGSVTLTAQSTQDPTKKASCQAVIAAQGIVSITLN